jgi:hypothetical protein
MMDEWDDIYGEWDVRDDEGESAIFVAWGNALITSGGARAMLRTLYAIRALDTARGI